MFFFTDFAEFMAQREACSILIRGANEFMLEEASRSAAWWIWMGGIWVTSSSDRYKVKATNLKKLLNKNNKNMTHDPFLSMFIHF